MINVNLIWPFPLYLIATYCKKIFLLKNKSKLILKLIIIQIVLSNKAFYNVLYFYKKINFKAIYIFLIAAI